MEATTGPQAKYAYMVIDSGAIIRNQGPSQLGKLISSAKECFMTPSVWNEIRDAKSREVLDQALNLYADGKKIEIRVPRAESIRVITEFARKTGDYRSLSGTDLEVLALQYELDVLGCGGSNGHLRFTTTSATEKVTEATDELIEDGESKSVDVEGDDEQDGTPETESVDYPVEEREAKATSWASRVSGEKSGQNQVLESKSLNDSDLVSFHQPFGKMNLIDASETNGQFDDAEEEIEEVKINNQNKEVELRDDVAKELEQEFPSLGAAMTVPDDDSCDEGDNIVNEDDEAEIERRRIEEALKPKLTKDGRHYNPFNNSKYRHLFSDSGIGKSIKDKEEIKLENEIKKATFARELQHSKLEADSSKDESNLYKNRSRIINGGSSGITASHVDDEVEDDGEGWVNVSNFRPGEGMGFGLKNEKKKDNPQRNTKESSGPLDSTRAACATTDFAMQNVILRIGMKLTSVDGLAIRRVKQWVTRCGACFTTYADDKSKEHASRLFCDRCGSDMLQRIAASVDGKTGRYILHLSKKRQKKINLRGTKFSLPKAGKGNRFEGDLLLREDQLMMGAWNQKVKKGRGKNEVQSIFGSDIATGMGLNDITKRDDIQVGFGRRNPNSAKFGRERRGKKKKNAERKACGLRRNF